MECPLCFSDFEYGITLIEKRLCLTCYVNLINPPKLKKYLDVYIFGLYIFRLKL